MKPTMIDNDQIDDLLNRIHRARVTAPPDATMEEYAILSHADDGKIELRTGLVPRGFFPTQPLKKSKKKPATTRRPRHVKRR